MNAELLKFLIVIASILTHTSDSQEQDLANTVNFRPKQKYMQPEELLTIRDNMDLTQDAMATLMNTTQPNLSKMENGFIRIRKRRADQVRQIYQEYLKTHTKLAC